MQRSPSPRQSHAPSAANTTQRSGRGERFLPPAYGIDFVDRQRPPEPASSNDVVDRLGGALGVDVSSLKIDSNSALAIQLGADAVARGNELHFAPGKFQPNQPEGRALIGEELAHVVQQQEGLVRATDRIGGVKLNDDPALEIEAKGAGRAAAESVDGSPATIAPAQTTPVSGPSESATSQCNGKHHQQIDRKALAKAEKEAKKKAEAERKAAKDKEKRERKEAEKAQKEQAKAIKRAEKDRKKQAKVAAKAQKKSGGQAGGGGDFSDGAYNPLFSPHAAAAGGASAQYGQLPAPSSQHLGSLPGAYSSVGLQLPYDAAPQAQPQSVYNAPSHQAAASAAAGVYAAPEETFGDPASVYDAPDIDFDDDSA